MEKSLNFEIGAKSHGKVLLYMDKYFYDLTKKASDLSSWRYRRAPLLPDNPGEDFVATLY